MKFIGSGIYKIVCKNNNKFYIGSSTNINKRLNDHVGLLKRNKHSNTYLQDAWNKYGEKNFRYEIVETIHDISQLPTREKWWIDDTDCCNRKIGFNISSDPYASNIGRKFIDLTGQIFDKLTVLKYIGKNKYGNSKWLCKCYCDNETVVLGTSLQSGHTKSCGCLRKEHSGRPLKHGHSKDGKVSKTYAAWDHMIQRCTNIKNPAYKNYGERGIIVCDAWLPENNGFINFLSDIGEIPKGLTLDRIDNNGNYEPDNWRFATPKQQANNRRKRKIK